MYEIRVGDSEPIYTLDDVVFLVLVAVDVALVDQIGQNQNSLFTRALSRSHREQVSDARQHRVELSFHGAVVLESFQHG